MTRLRAQIISNGDSPAIRLPALIVEQSGLGPDVELEVERHRIVIQPASEVPRDSEDASTDDEIASLYVELRELMARSKVESGLDDEIQSRFRHLRRLQAAEADVIQARFESRRHLAPGRGWKALERAREILGDEDPTAIDETADS